MLVVRHVGTARLDTLDTLVSTRSTHLTCRVVSRRDEPSGIVAYLFFYRKHLNIHSWRAKGGVCNGVRRTAKHQGHQSRIYDTADSLEPTQNDALTLKTEQKRTTTKYYS